MMIRGFLFYLNNNLPFEKTSFIPVPDAIPAEFGIVLIIGAQFCR